MDQQPLLISGRVVDEGDVPLSEARVFFVSGPVALQDVAAMTGEDGHFCLSAPVPGTYQLQFVADNFKPRTLGVEVGEGRGEAMEIRLEKG